MKLLAYDPCLFERLLLQKKCPNQTAQKGMLKQILKNMNEYKYIKLIDCSYDVLITRFHEIKSVLYETESQTLSP